MIFTPRLLPALLLLACAACGGAERDPAAEWRAALARGDGAAAEVALRRQLAARTSAELLAPFLGEAELRQGNLPEAERWLAPGRFAPAVAVHGWRMLGRLRMEQGDLAAAGAAFDRALAAGADNPALWADIARLRYRGGEQAQALDAARNALALGPADPAALLLQGQLVRDADGPAAALPVFERGLAAAPRDVDLLAERAATLGELGRYRAMLAATRTLAEVAPGDGRAAYLQAVLALRAGRADLARSLFDAAGAPFRERPASLLMAAVANLEGGQPASAADTLSDLLRAQPDNAAAGALLAQALLASGRERELIARFGQRADDRAVALMVGRAWERVGDRAAAAPYLDYALGAPRDPQAFALPPRVPGRAAAQPPASGADAVELVRVLIFSGRRGDARGEAERWLRRVPGSADAAELAGDAAYTARDFVATLAHYRQAAEVRRTWPLTRKMAATLEALGRAGDARALVAAHAAGEPLNREAHALLARSGGG